MSKFERAAYLVVIIGLAVVIVNTGFAWESERSKREALEAENTRITSIMDRVVKAGMQTRYTTPDCYKYQGEISLLIAEYYGHERVDPDSLLAVPLKDISREWHSWQIDTEMIRDWYEGTNEDYEGEDYWETLAKFRAWQELRDSTPGLSYIIMLNGIIIDTFVVPDSSEVTE